MRFLGWLAGLVLTATAFAAPVTYRLASLPATAVPGQKLILCAANIGTGALDVTLEFLNVGTGDVVAEKTVKLAALGSAPAASSPCVSMTAATQALGNTFAAGSPRSC